MMNTSAPECHIYHDNVPNVCDLYMCYRRTGKKQNKKKQQQKTPKELFAKLFVTPVVFHTIFSKDSFGINLNLWNFLMNNVIKYINCR